MEVVNECWTKRRICRHCAAFTQMCGRPNDDDDYCWLSPDTRCTGSLPDQEEKKENCVILLYCPSAQQSLTTALSAHSLHYLQLSASRFTPPTLQTPPPTAVEVPKKHREGPSPWKMQHGHAQFWIHGLFSRQTDFSNEAGINVNVERGHGLNSTSTIGVWFYWGVSALDVRLIALAPS